MLFSFILWALFVFKFFLAIICSIFVYYRIINDQQYSGLREYICVTVSENIDELVERQRKKENDNTIYKSGLLESQTFNDFNELESKVESAFNETSYTSNNDSTIELIERGPESISQDAYGPILTMKKTETMESIVDNGNLQHVTRFSAILDSSHMNSYNDKNIKITEEQTRNVIDISKYKNLPLGNFSQNSSTIKLLESTPSREFHKPSDSKLNITSNFSRPRPPSIQTSGSVNLNAAPKDYGRVYTPMKAHFREADLPRKGLLEDEGCANYYT